jgi:hypothetical protein
LFCEDERAVLLVGEQGRLSVEFIVNRRPDWLFARPVRFLDRKGKMMMNSERGMGRAAYKVGVILVVMFLPALATEAWSGPVIDIGSIYVAPDTTHMFAVSVTGGDAVQGLNFYIQLGDGGTILGGTDTRPIFTSVDIVGVGTIFQPNNTGQNDAGVYDLLWATTTTTFSGEVNAEGVLAYVTIDTAGTTVGESYALRLTDVSGFDTDFAGVDIDITNGTIYIVSDDGDNDIVPEPVSLGIAGLVIAGLSTRRRR